ncbi:MAG: hypothetical protein KBG20_21120 [Caldilineaceae bacterium]|nr:hypothetical protein [Caldilineaceae bacterium]MBP8108543.1 hypothetical protein [Caldilineaceae bacterium]MBP8123521.1 hypothetical protein [Caldilineaceae bacterium]MBP9074822.1 hypothetical protein [Caldilineaceae bacterium]
MAKLSFTQENMPASSEEFRRLLAKSMAKSNPIDDFVEIVEDLAGFEKKHQMSSSEFYLKFNAGQLEDELDYFEWSFIYDAYVKLRRVIESALLRDAVLSGVEALEEAEAVAA